MVMAILQMRKGRMRKIKKPAQGPDEKVTSVNKSLLSACWVPGPLGAGDTAVNKVPPQHGANVLVGEEGGQ